jgi:thioredoxin-related protein
MRFILLIKFLVFSFCINAQDFFQPISFENALKQAKEEKKYILLQYESSTCIQCNEVADKGLDNAEVALIIKETFIPIKIDAKHPDRNLISSKYNINGFGSLFMDHNGNLIHSFLQSSTLHLTYLKQFEIFLNKAGETLQLNEMEKLYGIGNKSPDMLEAILLKRKSLSLSTDSLLEEYVKILPADSLIAERTLNFIAQMSPLLGSKADYELRKNKELFSKIWYDIPVNSRIAINNSIIYRSLQKAIKENNEPYAHRVAFFAKSTYSNEFHATRAFENQMLNFYKATNNLLIYFKNAVSYYDKYFMHISLDSLNEAQEKNFQRTVQANAKKEVVKDGITRVTTTAVHKPTSQRLSQELNTVATFFYKKTNDPVLLNKALEWAKQGNTIYETAEILDTYSRLLYKLNRTTEAIEAMEKSISLRRSRGFPEQDYLLVLENMKNNKEIN